MTTDQTPIDLSRKFVRLVGTRPNGLVEFEFSIGEPELFVEMLLPAEAFEAFCAENRVIRLDGERAHAGGDWDWSLADATHIRFR